MKLIADTNSKYALVLDDGNLPVTATTLDNFGRVVASSNSSFDSGLIPQDGSGMISLKTAGGFTQITYQQAPEASLVKWGQYERDNNAVVYKLANPYKIWIADFDKGLLVGLRHFFSPEPIYTGDQILYHAPYPNTNCKGYSDTSVGWVCLYRTGNKELVTVQDMIMYAWERESGLHEPYNNSNMSETDGPRFYKGLGIELYNDPVAWAKKTEQEGLDWICDPKMLIAVKTKSSDELNTRHDSGGDIYTFDMAISHPYYPYYPHKLSNIQKSFYSKGWNKSGELSKDFDPKTLSKLASVELPSELSLDTIVSELNLKPVTPANFDVYDHSAAVALSELIINSRNMCIICGNYSPNMTYLLPLFMTRPANGLFESTHINSGFEFTIGRVLSYNMKISDHHYGCESCWNQGFFHKYDVPSATYNADDRLMISAAVLTVSGSKKVTQNESSNIPVINETNMSNYKDVMYSRHIVDVKNSDYPIPQTHTISCLSCKSIYRYDLENMKPHFDDSFIGIIYTELHPEFYLARYCIHCANCSKKNLKISEHLLPDFKSLPEFKIHFSDILKGKKSNISPLSEMTWMFKTESEPLENNIVINDLNLSDNFHSGFEQPYRIIDFAVNELYHNLLVKYDIGTEEYYTLQQRSDLFLEGSNASDWGYDDFETRYAPAEAYVLTIFESGFWEIYIDTLENLQCVDVCQCQIKIEDNQMCVQGAVENATCQVCLGCSSLNDQGKAVYLPLVDHFNTPVSD